ncbi:MAG: hypothetical protein ACREQV_03455 [Candidatus Binatia bacterium]
MKHVLVSLLVVCAATASAGTITFADNAVNAAVTPGASAVIFGIGSQPRGYYSRLVRFEAFVSDEDRDGSVSVQLDDPVPPKSTWVVVDLASGEVATGAPSTFAAEVRPFPSEWLKHDNAGHLRKLASTLPFSELLWASSMGAWKATLGDGGASDEDGEKNGVAVLDNTQFLPIQDGIGKAPTHFSKGDVMIAANPWTLTVYVSALKD